jgi:hypothetical protein
MGRCISRICRSRSFRRACTREERSSSYSSGSRNLKQRSSSSHFTWAIPSRWARGA